MKKIIVLLCILIMSSISWSQWTGWGSPSGLSFANYMRQGTWVWTGSQTFSDTTFFGSAGSYILGKGNDLAFYDTNYGSERTLTQLAASASGYWTQSGSNIYYNSGKVGIGTAAPAKELHISSGSPAIRLQDSDSDGGGAVAFLEFYDSNSRTGFIGDGGTFVQALGIAADAGYGINFAVNGANVETAPSVIINSSGNAGIGTKGPDGILELNMGTNKVFRMSYNDADGSATDYSQMAVNSDGALTISTVDAGAGTSGNIVLAPDGVVNVTGKINNTTQQATTLGVGVTTFAVTRNVATITGDGAGNTIATITAGGVGLYTFIFTGTNITITDTDAHTANTVDLAGTATNFTSADDKVLQLVFDGTSWYEVSRSTN